MTIRPVQESDAAALLAIYAPYVENTAVSFELTPPTLAEFTNRIRTISAKHPYLVAEEEGKTVGYAYASTFKPRAAYDHSVETTIYMRSDSRGRGMGRELYAALERACTDRGFINLNACIAYSDDPDDPFLTRGSPLFHERCGYAHCAHFHRCARKFGRFYDMIWMEKLLTC